MADQFEDTDSAAESTLLQESRDQLTSEREALARFRELSSLSAPQLADTELSQANKPNPYLDEMMRQEKTAFQQQQEAAKAKQDAIAARNRAMIPAYDEYEKALRGDIANPPQQPPPPVIPRAPTRDQYIDSTVAKSMFAVASMMAGLAIGGGRGRGMLAMAGMRGALQGLNEKNAQKYKDGMDEYKENVNAQIQEYNALYRQYLDQVQAKNLGLAERYRLVELTALRNNDPITAAMAAENDADKLFKHLDDYGKMITQMEKVTQGSPFKMPAGEMKVLLARRAQGEMTGIKDIDALEPEKAGVLAGVAPKPGTGAAKANTVFDIPMDKIPVAPPGEKNEAFLAMLPPATQELVKAMASGKLPVSGFGGLDVNTRSNLLKAAQIYDPGSSAAQKFVTGMKSLNELTPGGPVGTNVLAINTMVHHIDQFATNFARLNNSQVQKWNEAKNKLSAQFGDPALGVVQQSAIRVADEYARIIKGGRASPTEQDMRLWESIFTTSMSPNQMRANVWDALQGAGGRLAALQDAYADFPDKAAQMISPETKQIIEKWKPKNTAIPPWLSRGALPSGSGLPSSAKRFELRPGEIFVKRKSDGQPGAIMENKFDPAIYERVPEGGSVQTVPLGTPRVSRGFEY